MPGLLSGSSPVRKLCCRKRICAGLLLVSITLLTAAAGIAAPTDLQQVPLSPLKARADASPVGVHARQPGGLNQQIQPASTRSKFAAEAARSGTDIYVVR